MRRRRTRILCLLGAAWLLGYYGLPAALPLPEGLVREDSFAPGATYADREGRPLRRLLAGGELRIDAPVTLDEVPRHLVDATLAAEDSRFRSHGGIDFLGLARAVRDALLHREFVSGASTVTQQLVKISSPPRARDLRAKVVEMAYARKLELTWDKDAILAAYLNRLPYGNQLTGCRAAARGYFDKPIGDLSLAESAFLAALPNKPTRFNPYRNFDGARQRQLWILGRLREEGWITAAEHAAAAGEPLRLAAGGPAGEFEAPHFIELVRRREAETGRVAESTTLDLSLQRFVEGAIDQQLTALDAQIGHRLSTQAAVVVIENATGEVVALAGSRGFHDSAGGQNNGAWTPRSPGSALKPFTYLLALERGLGPGAVFADVPVEYPTPTGAYRPVNYDRRFRGPVTMRHALANSLNVPAIRALDGIGGTARLHEALTKQLGFTGLDPNPATYGLGLTLGTAEVRLLELTNAYACLARLGIAAPFRLTREKGMEPGLIGGETLFDRDACWLVADMLSDNLARAAEFGLHSPLRFPFRVAAKTGTSTDYRDNWTLGFTPAHTVGVWVGHFGNQPLQNVSGVSGAGPIFHAVVNELNRRRPAGWYERPESLVEIEIDPRTGRRVVGGAGFRPRQTVREWCHRDRLPPPARAEDYDGAERVRLEATYAAWLAGEGRSFADRFVVDAAPAAEPRLRIVSPLPGTVAYLDPDLPGGGRRFPLKAESDGVAEVRWSSETLKIESETATGRAWLILEPGSHEIVATDPRSGLRTAATIAVEAL